MKCLVFYHVRSTVLDFVFWTEINVWIDLKLQNLLTLLSKRDFKLYIILTPFSGPAESTHDRPENVLPDVEVSTRYRVSQVCV